LEAERPLVHAALHEHQTVRGRVPLHRGARSAPFGMKSFVPNGAGRLSSCPCIASSSPELACELELVLFLPIELDLFARAGPCQARPVAATSTG